MLRRLEARRYCQYTFEGFSSRGSGFSFSGFRVYRASGLGALEFRVQVLLFRVSGLGVEALGCFWLEGLKVRMQHVGLDETLYSKTQVPKTEATNGNSRPEALRREPQ